MNRKQAGQEPEQKRAVAFFDGQNLYRHAKTAFGHHHPNYDPQKLHAAICQKKGWQPSAARFYTGVPKPEYSPQWRRYWERRFLTMSRTGVHVTKRVLQYHQEEKPLPGGTTETRNIPREKGIDVRLALDVVRLARENQYDVAILFSQDQDLAEAIEDVKEIARGRKRWIKLVCAFPDGPNASSRKGIRGCDWFRMDEDFYNACLDPRDYRR